MAAKKKNVASKPKTPSFNLLDELKKLEPTVANAFSLYIRDKDVKTLDDYKQYYKQFMGVEY